MANVLPTLRGSSQQVLYPVTRIISCATKVTTFPNGSEQRWAQRPPLMGFEIPMDGLSAANKASWLSFFATQKGRLNKDLQLTVAGITYSNMTLLDDHLASSIKRPTHYDQSIRLRQVLNYPYTFPAALSVYPTLSFGRVAEMPFAQISRFQTSVTDSPMGPRFSFGWFGTGLTNFPTSYLRSWILTYPILDDADALAIEAAFLGWQGRYKSFSFTDPLDAATFTHVRCDQDELTIRYEGPHHATTELRLVETYNS